MSYNKQLVRKDLPKTISSYTTDEEYAFIKEDAMKEGGSIAVWFRDAVVAKMKKRGWKQKKKSKR